ncbi:MAG: hypothetical protein J1E95_04195 [Muribaculaceae bacterium]|nr:hypothetical protein [Muribaculaceae bacterium]
MSEKKISEYAGPIGRITKVNSKEMVENLNAQFVGGSGINDLFTSRGAFNYLDVNWNDFVVTGMYNVFNNINGNHANSPGTDPSIYKVGTLWVFAGYVITQIYLGFAGNADNYSNLFIRCRENGKWGSWRYLVLSKVAMTA